MSIDSKEVLHFLKSCKDLTCVTQKNSGAMIQMHNPNIQIDTGELIVSPMKHHTEKFHSQKPMNN